MSTRAGEDDELKSLKEELRRRRQNGERGWYIRNRRLVNLNRRVSKRTIVIDPKTGMSAKKGKDVELMDKLKKVELMNKLKEELQKKWDNGETNWYIRNGRLVNIRKNLTPKRKPSTSEDVELQNKLKEELKKKLENGEAGWYIRKGKLIQRTPKLYERSNYYDQWPQLNHGRPDLHSMANHHDKASEGPLSQGNVSSVFANQPSRGKRSAEPAILRYNRWKKSQREKKLNKNKQDSQVSGIKTEGTSASMSANDSLSISGMMDCEAWRSAQEEECQEMRDQQSAEESYLSARRSKSCRQTLGPTKLFVATFNPEDKLHNDTRYFKDGSSDDSDDDDDDGGGVKYEDPTTLLLLGKTKGLMKLLQVYRKNTIDADVKEDNQEPSCSGEQDSTSAGAHKGQLHVTSSERRLNKLPPVGNPMMRIDGVMYMTVLTLDEEKALMRHLIGEMCDKTYVSLTEVCHWVCKFCKKANISIPPAWKSNPVAAKEWVKAFVTHRQLFTFIPSSKEDSGKDDSSAARGSMTRKQAPNFYVCDNGTMIHREALIDTIQQEHDYIITPDTQVILVSNVNGGIHTEVVKP